MLKHNLIADSGPSGYTPAAEIKRNNTPGNGANSPLLVNLDTIDPTAEAFHYPHYDHLNPPPALMWRLLARLQAAMSGGVTPDEKALQEIMVEEQKHFRQEEEEQSRRCHPAKATGIAALLALLAGSGVAAWRFSRSWPWGAQNINTSTTEGVSITEVTADDIDSDIVTGVYTLSDAPRAEALKLDFSVKDTNNPKKCWVPDKWMMSPPRLENCPDNKSGQQTTTPRATTTTTAKPAKKQCWYHSMWSPGPAKPGPCPEDRPHPVSKAAAEKKKHSPKPAKPASNIITYYTKRNQPAACTNFKFHSRCENVHPNYKDAQELILYVNSQKCYCPPPEKNRKKYDVVYLDDDATTTTTTPASATSVPKKTYYMKQNQPAVCQQASSLERCEKVHGYYLQLSLDSLLLKFGKSDKCYCPPPTAQKELYDIVYLDNPAPTTPSPVSKKKYYLRKYQPNVCGDKGVVDNCEKTHTAFGKNNLTSIMVQFENYSCYCQPPKGKEQDYELIYTDIAIPPSSMDIYTQKRNYKFAFAPFNNRKYPQAGTLPANATTVEKGDVKIEKMFDLSCLEVRNNMQDADWLRAIGKTLSAPVTQMTEEVSILYKHAKGEGCPSPEQLEKQRAITSGVDMLLSMVLTMLPGSQPLAIAQFIVGPTLSVSADILEGKPLNAESFSEILAQTAIILRDLTPTLNSKELSALYGDGGQKGGPNEMDAKNILSSRFNFNKGQHYIKIDGVQHKLKSPPDYRAFIIDAEGDRRFVQFNQKQKQWVFITQHDDWEEIEHKSENKAKYGMPIKMEGNSQRINLLSTPGREDINVLVRPEKPPVNGVFIDDVFVPVEQMEVDDQWVTVTATSPERESKILRETDHGWIFEAPSTKMDSYLRLLLKDETNAFTFSGKNKFRPINKEGMSLDDTGNANIKLDDRYYPVSKSATDGTFTTEGHPGSVIEREGGVLKLKKDESMVSALESIEAGDPAKEKGAAPVYIEQGTAAYLQAHGDINLTLEPVEKIQPALYKSQGNELVFTVEGKNYPVTSHNGREIMISRLHSDKSKKDIKLVLLDDTYIRVRDENPAPSISYKNFIDCRTARSPNAKSACMPVVIEDFLDELLHKYIVSGQASSRDILDARLTPYPLIDVPVLYNDPATESIYFLHQGHYFKTYVSTSTGPANQEVMVLLHIYGKGSFFSKEKYITTIMLDKKPGRIEIKTQSTFVSEQLNVSPGVAQHTLKSWPYRFVGGVRAIEDAVNEVVASGKFILLPPKKEFAASFPEVALKLRVKNMYPERIAKSDNYHFSIFTLNDSADSLTAFQQKAQQYLEEEISYIDEFLLPDLIGGLNYNESSELWRTGINYVHEILGTSNSQLVCEFVDAMLKRLRRIGKTLDRDKIRLVTASLKEDQPSTSAQAMHVITDEERKSGEIAFMAPDKDGYIYINADKAYTADSEEINARTSVLSILVHEASHTGGMTSDFVYVPRENGYFIPSAQAFKDMATKIREGKIIQPKDFKKMAEDYMKQITVYRNKIPEALDNEQLAYLFEHDPGFRANFILHSADPFTLVALDLYDASAFGYTFPKPEVALGYSRPENFMSVDEYGVLFNSNDGYMMKDYISDARYGTRTYLGYAKNKYETRLGVAMNNVRCLNRIYGPDTASVIISPIDSTISVKSPKVFGEPVSSVLKFESTALRHQYQAAAKKILMQGDNPAIQLWEKLIKKGVLHHKISLNDLSFDKDLGFDVMNYDSATLWPEGEEVPESISKPLLVKLKDLMTSFGVMVGLPGDELSRSLERPNH